MKSALLFVCFAAWVCTSAHWHQRNFKDICSGCQPSQCCVFNFPFQFECKDLGKMHDRCRTLSIRPSLYLLKCPCQPDLECKYRWSDNGKFQWFPKCYPRSNPSAVVTSSPTTPTVTTSSTTTPTVTTSSTTISSVTTSSPTATTTSSPTATTTSSPIITPVTAPSATDSTTDLTTSSTVTEG